MEALNESNRALSRLTGLTNDAIVEAKELKDIRAHWAEWRVEWEHKLATNEMQFLRSVADLQSAFQHRSTLMETNYREVMEQKLSAQNKDFHLALERAVIETQQRLWADLDRIRTEFERLIHLELRVVRQRAALHAAAPAPVAAVPAGEPLPKFDYEKFADRFRGAPEYVKEKQALYIPYFQDCKELLDIGCGRGEFLELMKENGVEAHGIDLSDESVAICRSKGLGAEAADLFRYLEDLPESSLDGIFCAQVVEHILPARLPDMIRLMATRLRRGGLLAVETPNPECLAIFATHFYLDPTHQRPVPVPLLVFYLEEFGMGHIDVHRLSPAVETMPSLASLPEDFRNAFFGGLDYAVLARRL
jgi:2-polyprenyl-3-methyl-5-hydroxy-6-metoxy-1,4-benzoquinol methylase